MSNVLSQSGTVKAAVNAVGGLNGKISIPFAHSPDGNDVPQKLPNPHPITFTGAVNATYDGSEAVIVKIPQGVVSAGASWRLIRTITITEDVKAVYESVADLALKNYRVHLRIPKAEGNYEAALKIDNKYYWLAYTMPRQHGDIDEIIELTQLEDAQLVERTATNVFTAANYGTGTMRSSAKNIVDFMGNSPTELRIGSNVSLAGTVLKIYDLG
jgi:hypothetical protein